MAIVRLTSSQCADLILILLELEQHEESVLERTLTEENRKIHSDRLDELRDIRYRVHIAGESSPAKT